MIRSRKYYLLFILTTIALGLLSRTAIIPDFIYPYLEDYLYAIMYFFIFGMLFPRKSSLRIAIYSILFCYLIELTQLSQASWLNQIRSYKIGALVLGHGFLWSDIISYTLGGITALVIERGGYKSNYL